MSERKRRPARKKRPLENVLVDEEKCEPPPPRPRRADKRKRLGELSYLELNESDFKILMVSLKYLDKEICRLTLTDGLVGKVKILMT